MSTSSSTSSSTPSSTSSTSSSPPPPLRGAVSGEEGARYGRQLLLEGFGVGAQSKLASASVLIIGGGALGCPAALYLAGAGVGKIGIVDGDTIELSNLHRQIAHHEEGIGSSKASSIQDAIKSLNRTVEVEVFNEFLTPMNALEIAGGYSVLMDCSDNLPTRYLVNDVSVILDIPLVQGSALGFDGQLTVYNYDGGPCMLCRHPKPPPAHTVGACSSSGVLGPIPGTIGTLQALEVMKIIAGVGQVLSRTLLLFSGLAMEFTRIRMPKKRVNCVACGDRSRTVLRDDYNAFCGMPSSIDTGEKPDESTDKESVSVSEFAVALREDHTLLDVRERKVYQLSHLEGSLNIPLAELKGNIETVLTQCRTSGGPLFVICRRGNDSLKAVNLLKSRGIECLNVKGGYHAYSDSVDSAVPKL